LNCCIGLGFDSLAESDQKTLKVDIHSFPACRSAFKGYCEDRLLGPWVKVLNGIASILEWLLTGGSLTRRPQRSLRCLLADTTWQINEQEQTDPG